jgi:hypothetical protein
VPTGQHTDLVVGKDAHLASTVKISAALTNKLLSSIKVAPPIYLPVSHLHTSHPAELIGDVCIDTDELEYPRSSQESSHIGQRRREIELTRIDIRSRAPEGCSDCLQGSEMGLLVISDHSFWSLSVRGP